MNFVQPDGHAVQVDAVVAGPACQVGHAALATIVLVGVQPQLTQVPPISERSARATFQPALRRERANGLAA